ncbi:hypothetical protein E3P91_03408 [Wallemia ichthyophaga]|nr:hypothetical protein E3P91_03408 [Wallemia ichthyophaga]TIB59726.1 hypothetical protein E3P78_03425 [Wallemia ichthyophaga]
MHSSCAWSQQHIKRILPSVGVYGTTHAIGSPQPANQRCGVWYMDPSMVSAVDSYRADIYAYFKSTDGHTHAWSFSLRRPNLHLVNHIVASGGLVIVDSTRRGKRYPDAISKTIPIWCAVVSAAMLGTPPETLLHTPAQAVSDSEQQCIRDQLRTWTNNLRDSALQLTHHLDKPIRPIFVHPATEQLPDFNKATLDFYPLICVSASRYVPDETESLEWGEYVQGSGDDHELWSGGLTPECFWANRHELLNCPRELLDERVAAVAAEHLARSTSTSTHSVRVGDSNDTRAFLAGAIFPAECDAASSLPSDIALVALTPQPPPRSTHTLHVQLPRSSKQAQKQFLGQLPHVMLFVRQQLDNGRRIAVSDASGGTDLASAVCVAAATLFFDENGERQCKAGDNESDNQYAASVADQCLPNDEPLTGVVEETKRLPDVK